MFDLAPLLSQISQFSYYLLSQFGINLLDLIIIAVVVFYAYEGYSLGLRLAVLDLCSFILSFIIALKFYPIIAKLLTQAFGLPIGFANAASFLLLAFLVEVFLGIFFRKLIRYMPRLRQDNRFYKFFKKTDHVFGLIPGTISAFIILAFFLSVIVSLPTSPLVKNLVTDSRLGGKLLANTTFFESKLNDVFGGALSESLNFLTVKPQSSESLDLNFKMSAGTVDEQAEQEMFDLVNKERIKAGLGPLVFDNKLRDVARAHSKDMFERGYFSHNTPEGKTPFDRMDEAGIVYAYGGENLALAPSTGLAMQGLMNSPGHRANILSPNFNKIGIGAIDGGIYGKMYTQEFTD